MSLTQEVIRQYGLDNPLGGVLKTSQFRTIEGRTETALTKSGDFWFQGLDNMYAWSRNLPWAEGVTELHLLSSKDFEIPNISVTLNTDAVPPYRASWYVGMPLAQSTLVLHVQPSVLCYALGDRVVHPKARGSTAHVALLSEEIVNFCHQYGILKHLQVAISLVNDFFFPVQDLAINKIQDEDTEDEWLVLNVRLKGDTSEVLKSYHAYTDDLIRIVPWPERSRLRLSYNLC